MKVKLLFFAALRERMRRSEGTYEFAEGETVSELARRVLGFDGSLLFAVNDSYVPRNHPLRDRDEVAFIPPVAGG